MKKCNVKGCDKPHKAKGFCNNHYSMSRRGKNPHDYRRRTTLSINGEGIKGSHKSYHQMIQRCTNKNNPRYNSYGGRGIKICDSWMEGFDNFYKDMGDRPKGMSLERIDNNGGYNPINCKWATDIEQVYNRRIQHNNTSGCAGVSYDKRWNGKWIVRVNVNGKRIVLGRYDSKEDAIKRKIDYVSNK